MLAVLIPLFYIWYYYLYTYIFEIFLYIRYNESFWNSLHICLAEYGIAGITDLLPYLLPLHYLPCIIINDKTSMDYNHHIKHYDSFKIISIPSIVFLSWFFGKKGWNVCITLFIKNVRKWVVSRVEIGSEC